MWKLFYDPKHKFWRIDEQVIYLFHSTYSEADQSSHFSS